MAALAYDMICSKDPKKYTRYGNVFQVQRKNIFYYVNTGNYNVTVKHVQKHPRVLDRRDEHGRTLLYLAARNGFHDICHFLLRSGCDTNQIQVDGSTALHAAAFYGHLSIAELLLEYGANADIKNRFSHTANEESSTNEIKNCILAKSKDHIHILLNQLKSEGFAKNVVLIKRFDKIIAKKILRNSEYLSGYSLQYLVDNWTLAWHGTKYRHLSSIMKYGLHPAGTVLSPNHRINPEAGHIALNIKVESFANWANAIFISPSIFYAADQVYAERIFSDGQRWCVVVEARVKPGTFTKHKQTLLNQRALLPNEPEMLEYRVAVTSDQDFILRVESNTNVIVTALVFVNLTFLENIDEYYQGNDLFANSDAERALFQ